MVLGTELAQARFNLRHESTSGPPHQRSCCRYLRALYRAHVCLCCCPHEPALESDATGNTCSHELTLLGPLESTLLGLLAAANAVAMTELFTK
eukprot:g27328.t1